MGKTLPSNRNIRHIIFFSILLFILSGWGELKAQVSLSDIRPFEMEFSSESDSSSAFRWLINPADISVNGVFSSIFPFQGVLSPSDNGPGYYILNRDFGTFVAVMPGDRTEGDMVNLTITNQSDVLIDRLHFTLDFAFRKLGERPVELTLSTRYNDQESDSSRERIFSTETSRITTSDWQTAGVNFLIEDLYLGPGESFDLDLFWSTPPGQQEPDEIAIRRVELLPEEYELSGQFSMGDLVITEVLPSINTENQPLTYIEIYNSTDEVIDLRGWAIRTGESMSWIRESLSVDPYDMVLLANRDSDDTGINPDYVLPNLTIPSHGGIVDLVYGDTRIIRAAYDERQGGSAWELRSATASGNGYLSISDFRPATNRINNDLFGSPGTAGGTQRVFSVSLQHRDSWQLLSAPGFLMRTNNDGVYFQNELRGTPPSSQPEIPGLGFLVSPRDDEEGQSLLEASEGSQQSIIQIPPVTSSHGWQLLGNPYMEEIEIDQLGDVDGENTWKVAQTWDPVRQTFQLTTLQNDLIEPWQGFLVQNRNSDRVRFERRSESRGTGEATIDNRERYISFEITGSNRQQDQFHDEAAVLYFHNSAGYASDEFESEKLWPYFVQDQDEPRTSILYFMRSQQGETSYLAQMSRPYEVESDFEVRLGHASLNTSGTFTLRWPEMLNIPDTWSLMLIDNQTGARVDLRMDESYQFESLPYIPENFDSSDIPGIFPVEEMPSENRFSLVVDPTPESAESEEEPNDPEGPELYRNFPNPFDQITYFKFYLPEAQRVRIVVYNLLGQPVAELLDEVRLEGDHEDVFWDASNMPSSLYIVSLELSDRVLTREIIYVK